jgi:hypothetical protein
MPFSESLAQRVRQALARHRGIAEKKLFGGVGFMLHGNLLVCVWQTSLIVRLGPEAGAAALAEPHVRPFDVTGRPMRGWVMIDAEGLDTDQELAAWIDRALAFVATLPAK